MSYQTKFRYLCSELVSVLYEDRCGSTLSTIANLEEIARGSATLLLEAQLEHGKPITFRAKGRDMYGVVESSIADKVLGWYTKIKLDQCSRWYGQLFIPEHFLALCASASLGASEPRTTVPYKVFTRDRR
jgi:hypothetical protein